MAYPFDPVAAATGSSFHVRLSHVSCAPVHHLFSMKTLQRVIIGILGVLLLVVAVQALVPQQYVPEEQEPVTEQPCTGTPINVDYAFTGGYLEPWACQQQCGTTQQRYVLYTNGKATQCELLPGCNDYGEDNGQTCTPPVGMTPVSS